MLSSLFNIHFKLVTTVSKPCNKKSEGIDLYQLVDRSDGIFQCSFLYLTYASTVIYFRILATLLSRGKKCDSSAHLGLVYSCDIEFTLSH